MKSEIVVYLEHKQMVVLTKKSRVSFSHQGRLFLIRFNKEKRTYSLWLIRDDTNIYICDVEMPIELPITTEENY